MIHKISLFVIATLTLLVCSLPLPWSHKAPEILEAIMVQESRMPTYNVTLNEKDLGCMTEALFHEAGVETDRGREAVGIVILNRTQQQKANVCTIISQSRIVHDIRKCQFSYKCMNRKKPPITNKNWMDCEMVARRLLRNDFTVDLIDLVGKADHYHANYVNPSWSKSLIYLARVDSHLFYKSV